MTEPKRGDSRSGPCLTRQHERCRYAPCPCDKCTHANGVGNQRDSWDNGGTKTAPADNRGLTTTTVRSQ